MKWGLNRRNIKRELSFTGLPHLTVPLPSRNEPCIFVLKPVTHTIGDLLAMLKTEDPGIDRVVIRSIEGVRIASTTSIQTLMQSDFDLVINDVTYRVATPPFEGSSGALSVLGEDDMMKMGDVRALVGQLYEVNNEKVHSYMHTDVPLPSAISGLTCGRVSSTTRTKTH